MITTQAKGAGRIDWTAERDRIDLSAVATGLLGPAPGRTGERGRRLWWCCPFHDDQNPSFLIDPGKHWWKCWGCGQSGDAATLVMKIRGLTFPEAIDHLTGRSSPSGSKRPLPSPEPPTEPKPPEAREGPKGLPEAEALALVTQAEARLWSPEGSEALAYLTGPRCLALGTIRAARLGWTPGVRLATKDGRPYSARGWVIPWFDRDRLALVKIRQPEGDRPKYAEAFRDRPALYPDRRTIRQGSPVVIVEGEFDALLLGQELADLAAVVTLGSASGRLDSGILGSVRIASRWFIATDADDAGDRAATRWEGTRAIRVRPPEGFNDSTDAARGGIHLRRWWVDFLGIPWTPYPWRVLAGWRWGPTPDPEPGIVIDVPDSDRRRLALAALGTGPEDANETEPPDPH